MPADPAGSRSWAQITVLDKYTTREDCLPMKIYLWCCCHEKMHTPTHHKLWQHPHQSHFPLTPSRGWSYLWRPVLLWSAGLLKAQLAGWVAPDGDCYSLIDYCNSWRWLCHSCWLWGADNMRPINSTDLLSSPSSVGEVESSLHTWSGELYGGLLLFGAERKRVCWFKGSMRWCDLFKSLRPFLVHSEEQNSKQCGRRCPAQ